MKMEAGDTRLLALDIGTRKVTGLLLDVSDGNRRILAMETQEHQTRAMLDGQIHDIPKVAEVVNLVRSRLEQQAGCRLVAAAVAAAGRTLCTVRGKAHHQVEYSRRLREQDIMQLEYAAVLEAQQQLSSGSGASRRLTEQFHCVGFSVIGYFLDESPIGNLLDQRGSMAGCEVIATFLPRVVVDSLRSVLDAANLRLQSLTLEPIAALRMVVPENLRKLNLALVDVGAGTSDVAITRDGVAIAYDMVPVAGDELTEALCQAFLLDFLSAEELKRKLGGNTKLVVRNVLGQKITLSAEEVRETLTPALEDLGQKVAGAILRHNGSAPQAVFCVGGGSLLPGLPSVIAGYLGLDQAKVTVKGKEMTGFLPGLYRQYRGPELVTPLGIAYTALQREALRFRRVTVNGQNVDVMDLARGTVADALLASGATSRELVGRIGTGICVEVNGQLLSFPGERGEPAVIAVNGLSAALDTKISQGDVITWQPGKDGAPPRVSVSDLLSRLTPFSVRVNGSWQHLASPVYRDGQLLPAGAVLYDRDKVRVLKTMPLSWVLEQLNLAQELDGGTIRIRVNGTEREVPYGAKTLLVNGRAAVRDTPVSDGDILETCFAGVYLTAGSLTEVKPEHFKLHVNGTPLLVPIREVFFVKNGHEVTADALLSDGDQLEIREVAYEVTVADLLNLSEWQSVPPAGNNRLVLTINGRDAQFTTVVKNGDRLDVRWE
jgi:cell division ATPase FtsA